MWKEEGVRSIDVGYNGLLSEYACCDVKKTRRELQRQCFVVGKGVAFTWKFDLSLQLSNLFGVQYVVVMVHGYGKRYRSA